MNRVFTSISNVICGECGKFLVPEVIRDAYGRPTGEMRVSNHYPRCSLFGKVGTVKLVSLDLGNIAPEPEKAAA
jgi:hypothetical protein